MRTGDRICENSPILMQAMKICHAQIAKFRIGAIQAMSACDVRNFSAKKLQYLRTVKCDVMPTQHGLCVEHIHHHTSSQYLTACILVIA
eukprot:5147813-Pleurochrysis_carterae.AAC.2